MIFSFSTLNGFQVLRLTWRSKLSNDFGGASWTRFEREEESQSFPWHSSELTTTASPFLPNKSPANVAINTRLSIWMLFNSTQKANILTIWHHHRAITVILITSDLSKSKAIGMPLRWRRWGEAGRQAGRWGNLLEIGEDLPNLKRGGGVSFRWFSRNQTNIFYVCQGNINPIVMATNCFWRWTLKISITKLRF